LPGPERKSPIRVPARVSLPKQNRAERR
jgi:hypothetical protein